MCMKICCAGLSLILLQLTVQAQNNVGIGTNNPQGQLHIYGNNWVKLVLENNPATTRGYIGADGNGTITVGTNAFWTGSAWSYPFTGSSLYMLLHRANNRFEFRVRPEGEAEKTAMIINTAGFVGIGTTSPEQMLSVAGGLVIDQGNTNAGNTNGILRFGSGSGEGIGSRRTSGNGQYGLNFYTAGLQRMTISNAGNVGIGTDIPQAPLEILTGNNRSFRFRNDLVPTLEMLSGSANDVLAGTMRIRNGVEVWPNSSGTRAGKLDIRDAGGTARIVLDGSNGSIAAANLPSYAMKAEGYQNLLFTPIGTVNKTMVDITVQVPASGTLFVEAGVNGFFERMVGVTSPDMEIKLDEYSASNGYMSTLDRIEFFDETFVNPTIYYKTSVSGPVTKRYKLVLYKNSPGPGNQRVGPGVIKVWFYPQVMVSN